MYLNVRSFYSLLFGTHSIEQLVQEAAIKGVTSLALTDINNVTGTFEFIKACKQAGIKPIAGTEFRNGNRWLYTAIAKNSKGFKEINDFQTLYNLSHSEYPSSPQPMENAFIVYPLGNKAPEDLGENEYIGIRISDLNKIIRTPLLKHQHKLVMQQPVTFTDDKGYELHKRLRAIDNNIVLTKLDERHLAQRDEMMYEPAELLRFYAQYPKIIANTLELAEQCSIEFELKTSKNRKSFTGSMQDDKELLEKYALDGMVQRYGRNNKEAARRVKHELEIIDRLGFAAYFLITHDIVTYTMHRGFYHVGRGSGANSVVAYCLHITDVDPIELDLYFERFLNPKRTSPPDFDIDYSWKDRDEVYAYIFKRYKKECVALLGTVTTFQGNSIVRELGKVYGLPKGEIDEMLDSRDPQSFRNVHTKEIFEYGAMIENFPNHRSIHAGGVLISEEPITQYTALDLPPKGLPVVQWDMYAAEEIGFEKFDILSQRGIGHIQEAVEIIEYNRGEKVDVHNVQQFKKNPKINTFLQTAETMGCFYIESPAMRGLLKKLRCDNYLSLVAASSIIRPGVAQSGMMKEYIKRFHNPDAVEYLHPVMEEQLKETYGVMVYQEDVIKVAHHFGGLDLADADVLRRAMSGKYRGKKEFQAITQKYFDNCRAKGYSDALAKEVWRQIESFAGYSFSKAHSASFAVESYQSLFLKTYYPLEFITAVINNFGGFYTTWVYVQEARRLGGTIHLPCVNRSTMNTKLSGSDIYLGFNLVQGLETKLAEALLKEREQNGPYLNLADFAERTHTGLEQLIILIRTGTLRFTGTGKKALLWEAHALMGKGKRRTEAVVLFSTPTQAYTLPALNYDPLDDAMDEIELLGWPVSVDMFDLLKAKSRGNVTAATMKEHTGKTVKIVGRYITLKHVRTKRGDSMGMGTFYDHEGGIFDTVHFPQSFEKHPYRGAGCYVMEGKVQDDFGYYTLEVTRMQKLEMALGLKD